MPRPGTATVYRLVTPDHRLSLRVEDEGGTYRPVVTLFAITFLMAVGAASVVEDQAVSVRSFEWFVAFTMCGLGYLKLRDTESFSTMFLDYDFLAGRWVRYSYICPQWSRPSERRSRARHGGPP